MRRTQTRTETTAPQVPAAPVTEPQRAGGPRTKLLDVCPSSDSGGYFPSRATAVGLTPKVSNPISLLDLIPAHIHGLSFLIPTPAPRRLAQYPEISLNDAILHSASRGPTRLSTSNNDDDVFEHPSADTAMPAS